MKIKISLPQAIHQVGSRANQEDSIFPPINQATTDDRVFILCDGMGGHESGEVASGTVCQTMSSYILSHKKADEPLTDELFQDALDEAYKAINEKDHSQQRKMGTTLTFLCFHKGGCTVAHIGDSRVYHLRPETNEVLYRSRDHSLIYDLYEVGEITKAEMKTAKNKNVITRVIMANQERPSKADIVHIKDIKPGDYFYLCSDGMLEKMEDDELLSILGDQKTEEQKKDILIGRTAENSDNHSAYILRIEEVEAEEGDEAFPDNEAAARAANKVLNDNSDEEPLSMPPLPPTDQADNDDDVQVVTGIPQPQPIPTPQPSTQSRPQPPHAMPQPKKGNNGSIKLFAIACIAMILLGGIAAIFFLNNKDDDNKIRESIERTSQPSDSPTEENPISRPERSSNSDERSGSINRNTNNTRTVNTSTNAGRTQTGGGKSGQDADDTKTNPAPAGGGSKTQQSTTTTTTTTTPATPTPPTTSANPTKPHVDFDEE